MPASDIPAVVVVASKIMYAQPFIFKPCQKQTVNLWVFGVFQKGIKASKQASKQNSQAEVTEDFESVRKVILSFG